MEKKLKIFCTISSLCSILCTFLFFYFFDKFSLSFTYQMEVILHSLPPALMFFCLKVLLFVVNALLFCFCIYKIRRKRWLFLVIHLGLIVFDVYIFYTIASELYGSSFFADLSVMLGIKSIQ